MSRRFAVAAVVVAFVVVAGSACAPSHQEPTVYDLLPWIEVLEVDPKESFEELIEDSDLVVWGRVVDVQIVDLGIVTPVPDEAPDLRIQTQRIDLIVQPRGSRERLVVSTTRDFDPAQAHLYLRAEDVRMPKGEVLFALLEVPESAKADGWQYFCASADMGLCPLEIRDGRWTSPREPERGAVFSHDDPNHPGVKNARDVVRDLATRHGTPTLGLD